MSHRCCQGTATELHEDVLSAAKQGRRSYEANASVLHAMVAGAAKPGALVLHAVIDGRRRRLQLHRRAAEVATPEMGGAVCSSDDGMRRLQSTATFGAQGHAGACGGEEIERARNIFC
jgi:hypothetical protein